MPETAAVVLGAGWSVAAGLPLTRDLFDGHVVAGSRASVNRMSTVLVEYATWTARNPGTSAELFLLAAHGSTGGVGVPWRWVAEYLQARLAAPAAADSRGRSSLRYGQRITSVTYCPEHTNFWLDTLAEYELNAVVALNYDILVERSLRHRPMKRPPLPGFFYGGIPPQAARGTALPFTVRDAQREVTPSGTVPLFKVHGSLNWSIGTPGGDRPAHPGPVVVYQDVSLPFALREPLQSFRPFPRKTHHVGRWTSGRGQARSFERLRCGSWSATRSPITTMP